MKNPLTISEISHLLYRNCDVECCKGSVFLKLILYNLSVNLHTIVSSLVYNTSLVKWSIFDEFWLFLTFFTSYIKNAGMTFTCPQSINIALSISGMGKSRRRSMSKIAHIKLGSPNPTICADQWLFKVLLCLEYKTEISWRPNGGTKETMILTGPTWETVTLSSYFYQTKVVKREGRGCLVEHWHHSFKKKFCDTDQSEGLL